MTALYKYIIGEFRKGRELFKVMDKVGIITNGDSVA